MGIIQKVKQALKSYYQRENEKNNLSYSLTDYDGWTSAFVNSELNINSYTSFAASCIQARAEKVAEGTPSIFRWTLNGNKKSINSHPFYSLYETPNIYYQTGSDIDYLISTSLDLYGNAYVYYAKNRMGIPGQLIYLPTSNVSPQTNLSNTVITGYKYNTGTGYITYSTDEIIHFKINNPFNNLIGKPTIDLISDLIDTDYFQRQYNKNFYKNDATLGMTFSAPGKISDENYKRLNKAIQEKYSGYKNSSKHLILDNGMTAARMESSQRESQTNLNRIQIRDEILGAFKVPKSILGYTDDVNRANAESSRLSFMQNTIIPFANNISNTWDVFIKKNYDERLYFEYSFEMVQDIETVLRTRDMNARYNILSIDELREQQGYNPITEININKNG